MNGRYNYGKAVGLRKFFAETDWSSFHATRNTQEKWDEFIQIYMEGIDRYVPKMVTREKKENECFNRRYEFAILEKEKTWNKWRKKAGRNLWKKYKTIRN